MLISPELSAMRELSATRAVNRICWDATTMSSEYLDVRSYSNLRRGLEQLLMELLFLLPH
jgi:hypothetical protein